MLPHIVETPLTKLFPFVPAGRKRHLRRMGLSEDSDPAAHPGALVPCERIDRSETTQLTGTVDNFPIFYLLRCPGIREQAMEFLLGAYAAWSLRLPRPQDLPLVTRLNAFDALARNALVLGIPVELLESDDDESPFFHPQEGPQLTEARAYPENLSPTALQRSVRHHPWLDLLPVPGLRDNILWAIEAGLLDEERLSQELVCELLNLEASSEPPLTIWGDAWDVNGWEFSPDFFRRWAWLLRDSPEVWQATNYWRAKRREPRLEFILN